MTSLPKPNPEKSILIERNGVRCYRYPLKTKLFSKGDDFVQEVSAIANEVLPAVKAEHPGMRYVVMCGEKALAATQGRAIPIADITPRPLARFLSRYVTKTPYGIGLGVPETMELALGEVGTPRIILAAGAAALTKPLGLKGVFYHVAGEKARAIDGPTPYTIPPYNQYAVLGPKDPDRAASDILKNVPGLSGVAVVDANDLGQNILGSAKLSAADKAKLAVAMSDNPLGQKDQQTPVALIAW